MVNILLKYLESPRQILNWWKITVKSCDAINIYTSLGHKQAHKAPNRCMIWYLNFSETKKDNHLPFLLLSVAFPLFKKKLKKTFRSSEKLFSKSRPTISSWIFFIFFNYSIEFHLLFLFVYSLRSDCFSSFVILGPTSSSNNQWWGFCQGLWWVTFRRFE